MYKPNYLCDMHCHTTRSDGNDTPLELVDRAAELGMKIIAITDHDVRPPKTVQLPNGEEKDIVAYGLEKGVHVIRGTEISCETEVEDVHITLYGCDWDSPVFVELENQIKQSKIDGYRKLVDVLREHGMDLTWEEVLQSGEVPRKPEEVQKKHIFDLIARKGYTKTWSEAKLMVRNNPEYNVKRVKPDPVKVIQAAHDTGGIAILAHPYLIDEQVKTGDKVLSRDDYIEYLIQNGLDGIEASYTYDKTTYKGNLTKEEIYSQVIAKYENKVDIISGGSDYHADGKKGVQNPRQIGECGIDPEYFYNHPKLKQLIM